jgi:hypothetical protein
LELDPGHLNLYPLVVAVCGMLTYTVKYFFDWLKHRDSLTYARWAHENGKPHPERNAARLAKAHRSGHTINLNRGLADEKARERPAA